MNIFWVQGGYVRLLVSGEKEMLQWGFVSIYSLTWQICVTSYSVLLQFLFFFFNLITTNIFSLPCRVDFFQFFLSYLSTLHPVFAPECWPTTTGSLFLWLQVEFG